MLGYLCPTTPEARHPSPHPHPASLTLPAGSGRLARGPACLPPSSLFISHSALSMGTKGENENQGLVSASEHQAERENLAKSLVGLGTSSVSLTGLSATTEGVCLQASYFWGLIRRELSLRWRGGGRQQGRQSIPAALL